MPPQSLTAMGTAATVTPAGRLSLNPTPVIGTGLLAGLLIENVRIEVLFNGMLAGLNAFDIDAGRITLMLAVAVLPVPPFAELTVTVFV